MQQETKYLDFICQSTFYLYVLNKVDDNIIYIVSKELLTMDYKDEEFIKML